MLPRACPALQQFERSFPIQSWCLCTQDMHSSFVSFEPGYFLNMHKYNITSLPAVIKCNLGSTEHHHREQQRSWLSPWYHPAELTEENSPSGAWLDPGLCQFYWWSWSQGPTIAQIHSRDSSYTKGLSSQQKIKHEEHSFNFSC